MHGAIVRIDTEIVYLVGHQAYATAKDLSALTPQCPAPRHAATTAPNCEAVIPKAKAIEGERSSTSRSYAGGSQDSAALREETRRVLQACQSEGECARRMAQGEGWQHRKAAGPVQRPAPLTMHDS